MTLIRWCETGRFQEPCLSLLIGLDARSLFCLILFSLSRFSFNGLVLWGWGLRTDRVLTILSLCLVWTIFLIIMIIIIMAFFPSKNLLSLGIIIEHSLAGTGVKQNR